MAVNDANVKKFVHKTAHELAKKIKKDPKLPETDPEVAKVEEHVKECIRSSAPMIKEVVSDLISIECWILHPSSLYFKNHSAA